LVIEKVPLFPLLAVQLPEILIPVALFPRRLIEVPSHISSPLASNLPSETHQLPLKEQRISESVSAEIAPSDARVKTTFAEAEVPVRVPFQSPTSFGSIVLAGATCSRLRELSSEEQLTEKIVVKIKNLKRLKQNNFFIKYGI
jgi:hypothetical protein